MRWIFLAVILLALVSCTPRTSGDDDSTDKVNISEVQAYRLDGSPLYLPERSEEAARALNSKLDSARIRWENNPSEENYIWYGRRMAYVNRYNEAIEIYTESLTRYPESYKIYRHRGHRYISIREFDKAISDLEKAAELIGERPLETEPDGMPNALNIPLSNTHFNIYYHLGLAYYLNGEFESAEIAYRSCMRYSVNDDLVTATADWLYMTLLKQANVEEAEVVLEMISPDMEILENDSYYRRLLMYKGIMAPDQVFADNLDSLDDVTIATQGYGVGNYYLQNGDSARSREIFNKVISGRSWSAFGYIAAEAELFRNDWLK